MKIVTIGAYGFVADTFLKALQDAKVDTFVDLRLRRGVRGSEYAFVNSARLQQMLAQVGIRYLHLKELAPSNETRARQKAADAATGTAKRDRSELSPGFVEAYSAQCLQGYSAAKFMNDVGPSARVVAIFCVERTPSACHRSLVAAFLRQHAGVEVADLVP